LIDSTVQENILMDKPYDKDRLNKAIKYSALDIDLKTWDEGLNHRIGDGGHLISGGQKARVALARCLYRDSDIYLLDDIVSALDPGVAAFVMKETIGKYLRGKTVIMSTHNLSVLPYSDHVIYLEAGKIIKQGKFNEMQDNELWKKHLGVVKGNKTIQEKKEFDDLPEIELNKKISKDMTIINAKSNANKEEE
jgi:ABC-type transport system involved in cytochrome bd biosynthesis fused ATPase/permease subunit